MAPVLVASMPGDPTDGPGVKRIHPFFTGRPSISSIDTKPPDDSTSTTAIIELTTVDEAEPARQDERKRRKTAADEDKDEPQRKKRGRKKKNVSLGPSIADHLIKVDATVGSNVSDGSDTKSPPTQEPIPVQASAFCENANQPVLPDIAEATVNPQKRSLAPPPQPKKMLVFNSKAGTIGSPPKKPSKIVAIKYGRDDESRRRIGERIRDILERKVVLDRSLAVRKKRGRPRKSGVAVAIEPAAPQATLASAAATPPTHPPFVSKTSGKCTSASIDTAAPIKDTTTHPFFTGGLRKKVVTVEDTPAPTPTPPVVLEQSIARPTSHKISMATPCSSQRAPATLLSSSGVKLPQFGVKSLGLKVPGACDPAWPPLGMVHVRDEEPVPYECAALLSVTRGRRSKGRAVNVLPDENILERICRRLDHHHLKPKPVPSHEYPPRDPALRLPQKHLESGKQLQARVRPELRTFRPARPADDDELSDPSPGGNHPSVSRLHDLLQSSLSAFDRSDCENSLWAQKYAPRTASEVLQSARECQMFRDWLLTLKVQSVDTGAVEAAAPRGRGVKAPAKKRRKKNKLDGFVVSSDEEADEMDELPDEDDDWMSGGGSENAKKTVVKNSDLSGKDGRRLANAVVISGPHGCGKTAAVYAVAKELDFEVFEINPGSRRGGKDLIEKVGDMTRNHLVQHHHHRADAKLEGGADAESEDGAVARDIQSGKQGVMTSFFKPKPAPKQKPQSTAKGRKAKKGPDPATSDGEAKKATAPAPPRQQKQSLILVEEADVLFEEDKQFWTTLVTMMAASKRPFIMTCSDERLVPLQTLNLHGIFRLTQMPVDLGVDVLLLIAANEGHALRRGPVEQLYESRGRDMRAALMELNYWCQIGVGDQRGGFDWFFPRWPRGCDLDEHGDVVRVISDSTYAGGMGWFGRDAAFGSLPSLEVEEQLIGEAWNHWQLDLPVCDAANQVPAWASRCLTESPGDRLVALGRFGDFCDALSEADAWSGGSFGLHLQERVDPALPDLTSKARDSFIIGQQLLDAPLLQHQQPLDRDISSSIKSLATRVLHQPPAPGPRKPPSSSRRQTPALSEPRACKALLSSLESLRAESPFTRQHLSLAFDPIASPDRPTTTTATPSSSTTAITASGTLDPSVFDSTLATIVLDVAPWVRSIVASDQRLMQARRQRSTLLSQGGSGSGGSTRPAKRMRNTRAAFSALEGGCRTTTRRENYFSAGVNAYLVARTAGTGWEGAAREEDRRREDDADDALLVGIRKTSDEDEDEGTANAVFK